VKERALAPVLVHDDECGTGDRALDSKGAGHALHEAGLAAPKVAVQGKGRSGADSRHERGAAAVGAGGDFHVGRKEDDGRAVAGRETLHDPLDDELAVFATNDHEAADARRDVKKLLQQLPDNQRLPIVHTKLEGLSVTEAAAVTGMSESAIKVGVHRGMKALATLMSQSLRRTS
jgi:hypothetical protein